MNYTTVKLIEWKIIKNFKKHFHDFFAAASSSAYRQKPGSIPLLLKYVLVFQISQKVVKKYLLYYFFFLTIILINIVIWNEWYWTGLKKSLVSLDSLDNFMNKFLLV